MKTKKNELQTKFINQSSLLHWKIPMAVRADMSGPPMTILPGEVFLFQNRHNLDIYSPYSQIVLSGKLEQYQETVQKTIGTRPVYEKVMKTREIPNISLTKNKDWKLPPLTPSQIPIELFNDADFFVGASYRMIDYSCMMPYGIPVYIFVDANHGFAEHKRIIKKLPSFHKIIGPGGGWIDIKVPGSDVEYVDRSRAELDKLNEYRHKIEDSKIKNLKFIS